MTSLSAGLCWAAVAAAQISTIQAPAAPRPDRPLTVGEVNDLRRLLDPLAVKPRGCRKYNRPVIDIGEKPAALPDIYWPVVDCPVYSFEELNFSRLVNRRNAVEIATDHCRRFYCLRRPDALPGKGDDATKEEMETPFVSKVGDVFKWQGVKYKGAYQFVSEIPIGPWPCKQFKTTLTHGAEVIENFDMECFYKPSQRTAEAWVRVY